MQSDRQSNMQANMQPDNNADTQIRRHTTGNEDGHILEQAGDMQVDTKADK